MSLLPRSTRDCTSPYELWHAHSPPLHTLHVFGCPGTMVAPGKHKKKLQPQTVDVRFLGHHPMSSSIFCVLVNATGHVTHSHNVVLTRHYLHPMHSPCLPTSCLIHPSSALQTLGHHSSLTPSLHLMEQKSLEITAPRLLNSRSATTKVPMAKSSSGRTICTNTHYSQPDKKSPSSHALATDDNASPFVSYHNQQYHGMALALGIANHQTPLQTTLSKVLISSAKTEWLAAMKREFDTTVLNGTFELCPLPPGQKAISTCWVLKIKHDSSYKARWVAHGFSQHEGIGVLQISSQQPYSLFSMAWLAECGSVLSAKSSGLN